jgi:hypothetical protein
MKYLWEGRHDSYVWGGGVGGVRRWLDPEERCTRTPDSGSGHNPPRGKAKGAKGLDSKSIEAFIKICNLVSVYRYRYPNMFGPENENIKLAHSHQIASVSKVLRPCVVDPDPHGSESI